MCQENNANVLHKNNVADVLKNIESQAKRAYYTSGNIVSEEQCDVCLKTIMGVIDGARAAWGIADE